MTSHIRFYLDAFKSTLMDLSHSSNYGQHLHSFFSTYDPNSLCASVPPTPHGVDPINVQRLQVTEVPMEKILVQMGNVPNMTNAAQALLESLSNHVYNIAEENMPIVQAPIEPPNLTTVQYDESMAVVPEEICNLTI